MCLYACVCVCVYWTEQGTKVYWIHPLFTFKVVSMCSVQLLLRNAFVICLTLGANKKKTFILYTHKTHIYEYNIGITFDFEYFI